MTAQTIDTLARRSREHLKVLAHQGARELADADTDTIVAWAAEQFGDWLAVTSSMTDAVLPHVVSSIVPGIDVLFLDTGYHFSDTLVTRDIVANRLPVTVVDVKPRLDVSEQDAAYGPRLFERDPTACCRMRKVDPLREALQGYEAWMSGLRRDESPARAKTPVVAWDERNGMVKINPMVNWTHDEVTAYAVRHDVPVNLLVSHGYPSIGCEPCTRPVGPGEDERSGRWVGFAKTECGLHT